jgi:hypothetical protein
MATAAHTASYGAPASSRWHRRAPAAGAAGGRIQHRAAARGAAASAVESGAAPSRAATSALPTGFNVTTFNVLAGCYKRVKRADGSVAMESEFLEQAVARQARVVAMLTDLGPSVMCLQVSQCLTC